MKTAQNHRLQLCLAFVMIVTAAFIFGCGKSRQAMIEAPPNPPPSAADLPKQILKPLPPQLTSVQQAVNRVFKQAALLDTSREPSFIAGDFNGDLSEDIAVILKPVSGKLDQINEDAPPWILRDPFTPIRPGMPRLRIEENDVLLAVIHGVGPDNWRDPQATQTYLLKNAVGPRIEAHPQKDFVEKNAGKRMPQLHGDLIGEVLRGAPGYLYYTGATYAWYDPKSFKAEPERRLVHSRPGKGMDD